MLDRWPKIPEDPEKAILFMEDPERGLDLPKKVNLILSNKVTSDDFNQLPLNNHLGQFDIKKTAK